MNTDEINTRIKENLKREKEASRLIGMALGDIAKEFDASVSDSLKGNVVSSAGIGKGMYFSGDVVYHLSVGVDWCGLNNSGEWPCYLVNDNGKFKILSA